MTKKKSKLLETEGSVSLRGNKSIKTKCKFCCRYFVDKNNYAKHLQRSHEVPFKCSYCTYTTRVKMFLIRHMVSHGIMRRLFKCRFCDKEFKRPSNRRYHEISHIGILCKYCNEKFTSPCSVLSHIGRSHPEENKFGCEKCGKTFPTFVMRSTHLRNTLCGKKKKKIRSGPKANNPHGYLYSCNCCGKAFSSEQSLMVHKLLRKCESSLQENLRFSLKKHFNTDCVLCHQSVKDMSELRFHLQSEHKELYNPGAISAVTSLKNCHICGKFINNYESLIYHILKHLGFKPLKCHICNYRTNWKKSMQVHLVIHDQNSYAYDFTCNLCHITYFDSYKYRCHMRKEHNLKEFKYFCEKCGNGYYSAYSFKKHKNKCGISNPIKEELIKFENVINLDNQIKSTDTNFICLDCGFEFESSVLLQQHKVLFSFDRLCFLCGYLATHGSFLSCHLKKVHTSNCLQCDICNLIITNPKTYDKHFNSHYYNNNKKPYKPTPDSEDEDLFSLEHFQNYKNTSTKNLLKECLFECCICGKGFSNAHQLLDHEGSHKKSFNIKSSDKHLFGPWPHTCIVKRIYKNVIIEPRNTVQLLPMEFTVNEINISRKVESGSVIFSHPYYCPEGDYKYKLCISRPSYIFDDFLLHNGRFDQELLVSKSNKCSEKDKILFKLLTSTNKGLLPEIKVEQVSISDKLKMSKLQKQLNDGPMVVIKLSHFPKHSRLHRPKHKLKKQLPPTACRPNQLTSKSGSNIKIENKICHPFTKILIKQKSDLTNYRKSNLGSSKCCKILSSKFTVIDPLSKLPLSNDIFKDMKPLNLSTMSSTSVLGLKLVGTIHTNKL